MTSQRYQGSPSGGGQARWALLLLALLLWVPLLGPALPALGDQLLGIPHFDAHGTWWFYWHTSRILSEGHSPLHTDLLFFPWGKDIYGDTGANLLDAALALPFRAVLGPLPGYNLFVLLGLVATGLATAWATGAWSRDRFAMGVAGLTASVCPYALIELTEGRPTQALLALPALFLGALWRLPTQPGWRMPVVAGTALALTGYQYWYYAIFFGLAGLLGCLPQLLRQPQQRGVLLRRQALAFGLAVLLAAPGALPMLLRASAGDVTGMLDVDGWSLNHQRFVTRQGDAIALFLWQPLHGAAGFLHQHASGAEAFLGISRFTPLLTALGALGGLLHLRRSAGPLLAAGLLAGLLALGPVILVGSTLLPNPPYLALVELVPVFRRLWWPGRAYAVLALLGPVLLGLSVAALVTRRPGLRWPLVLVVGVGLSAEGWRDDTIPLPTWRPELPRGLACLDSGASGAVIALPETFNQDHLLYQVQHKRPTLGGMNSMLAPAEAQAFLAENSAVEALIRVSSADGPYKPKIDPADWQDLRDLGFRYVLVSWEAYDRPGIGRGRLSPDQARSSAYRVLGAVLGPAAWEDARLSIWDLHGEALPCEGITPETQRPEPDLRRTRPPLRLDEKDRFLRRWGDRD